MNREQIADALEQSIMGDTEIVKAAIAHLRASPAPAAGGMTAPDGFVLVPTDLNSAVNMGWVYLDKARELEPNKHWAFSPQALMAAIAAAPTASPAQPADSELDFTPTAKHMVSDLANIGYRLVQEIERSYPDFHWNESPVEILTYLADKATEATQPADSAASPAANVLAPFRDGGSREAIQSAIEFIEREVKPRRCDNPAVSACVRCNAVFLAKAMTTLLAAHQPPAQADHSAQAQAGCQEQFEALDVENHRLRRIVHELRTYNPAADEYKGEHIHKVWAREIEAAIGDVPQVALPKDAFSGPGIYGLYTADQLRAYGDARALAAGRSAGQTCEAIYGHLLAAGAGKPLMPAEEFAELLDATDILMKWCVKNVNQWHFPQWDDLHRMVEKARKYAGAGMQERDAIRQLRDALQGLMDLESRGRVMPAGKEWDAARAAIATREAGQ